MLQLQHSRPYGAEVIWKCCKHCSPVCRLKEKVSGLKLLSHPLTPPSIKSAQVCLHESKHLTFLLSQQWRKWPNQGSDTMTPTTPSFKVKSHSCSVNGFDLSGRLSLSKGLCAHIWQHYDWRGKIFHANCGNWAQSILSLLQGAVHGLLTFCTRPQT